jgi:hypothetical protein
LQFSLAGIVYDDDVVDNKGFSRRAVRYVKKYADFFCDLCLQGPVILAVASRLRI